MLREFPRVRQEPGEYRRLFCDDGYDLYVWYADDRKTIVGLQILYFEGGAQKVVTWRKTTGRDHMGIDDWDCSRFNRTPLLVTDGVPDYSGLLGRIEPRLADLDAEIRDLVLGVLSQKI